MESEIMKVKERRGKIYRAMRDIADRSFDGTPFEEAERKILERYGGYPSSYPWMKQVIKNNK